MSSSGEEEEDKEEVEEEKSLLSSSSAPIDLTREEEEKEEEEEEEPQPLAWRLLKRAAEKRCEEKQSRREEEDQQTLEAEPTPLEESSFLRNDFDDEEDDDDAQRGRGGKGGGGLGAPLSSPPDYSTKTDQELAKELAKFGMKRLGSRTAMIDCLMNIWTEKMVERGDGAAYSQRLEEELLSLSQRDQNACNNNNATNAVGVGMATKKRKNATTSTLRGGGERTPRTDEEEEEEEEEKQEDETDERALAAKLTAFLKSSRDVYASILRMEPLDLDEVKILCQNGLRMKCISKVKLAKYFESKGVAVRHKSNHAAKLRKRKKKNTLSSNISPIREELH